MISSSTSATRVGHLAQLSAKRTPVRVPESRLSNLRVDPPLDSQSVVVANACAARLSISFVVMTRRSLKLIQHLPAPAPLRLTERHGCGWDYVWLAWRQRAQIAERTRRACSPFHERFNEPEISQTRPSKILPQASPSTCRCLLEARTHDAWRKKEPNCFRFPPLRRCLKL